MPSPRKNSVQLSAAAAAAAEEEEESSPQVDYGEEWEEIEREEEQSRIGNRASGIQQRIGKA
ncbi:hypothetical protein Pmar_PMAR026252 [Perkinsus marinus ATCC 50983]|uniref:Uncharacterized protein n=1 Tax=Perkinsus marinus (strain ATCC 50983 / TXsc) TaxID=423536 RepID=C5LI42_PERM5|nr:hypothetical protein Pmar_PMAR026252 [Perkinsus marinus ATCC 50983]EER03577.1 hypothetical protein Pmar_PMAR026252 [Perkinsus marinus ATCC 50983]|eukprot:XP_002771761.1 hypothetical protein Pmar_PMAR026252 [Perkinsus marinus ATCC 50983]